MHTWSVYIYFRHTSTVLPNRSDFPTFAIPCSACTLLGNTMFVYDLSYRRILVHERRPEYCRLQRHRHGNVWTSQVPVRPLLFVRACSSDPGRAAAPDRFEGRAMLSPHVHTTETSTTSPLRGSIARHSNWLFTLHREDDSLPMQNSLPAAGQAFPGRLFLQGALRKVSMI